MMFDMNRDGKTDAVEWAIGMNILSNQEKHTEKQKLKTEQSLGRNKGVVDKWQKDKQDEDNQHVK